MRELRSRSRREGRGWSRLSASRPSNADIGRKSRTPFGLLRRSERDPSYYSDGLLGRATVPHAVLLTTDFRPMRGGIASYLEGLWEYVASAVPATVITTVPEGPVPWPRAYRLRVLQEAAASSPAHRLFQMQTETAEAALGWVREAGVNAQAFIGVWTVLSHFWCRALARAGVPYSLFAHDAELLAGGLWASVDAWREEDVHGARAVYAVSADTASRLAARYGGAVDVRVQPPGVEEPGDPAASVELAGALARQLDLEGKTVLLTVARLERPKGVDLVLESLAALAASFPGLRYVVAGDGSERARLQEQARALGVEPLVRFLGQVDEATKRALFTLCDVFVMPSRLVPGRPWEGFGISYLEAAACGKPSVGGRVGGTSDAVEDGVTGLLVDTTDARETLEALSRLLGDAALRARLGAAALARVHECFLWRGIGNRFLRAAALVGP